MSKRLIFVLRKSELLLCKVAEKNSRAAVDVLLKFRKVHVQLEGLPKSFTRFLLVLCAHQQIQRIAMPPEQSCNQVASEISG